MAPGGIAECLPLPKTAGILSCEQVGIADGSSSLPGSGKIWDTVTENCNENLGAE